MLSPDCCWPLLLLAVLPLRLLALQLLHVIFGGAAQFLHQLGDFLIRGAVFHRFVQTLLRAAHPLAGVVQVTLFKLQRQIPEVLCQRIALCRRPCRSLPVSPSCQ